MAKTNGNQHPKKRAFLTAYAEVGTITQAAKTAGIDRGTHYLWMEKDPEYVQAFAAAHEQACDSLEQEARRRAVEGWREPVYQQGAKVGEKRRYSDTLLIFLMKGNNPTKFGDKVEQTHKGDAANPVQFYIPENGR